jgi:putative transposase
VIAERLQTTEPLVSLWRRRFREQGLAGLYGESRPGRPRSYDDDQVAALITKTISSKPSNATQWTVRGLSAETGISKSAVQRYLALFHVQPHRTRSFKLSTDPFFVDKVRDVVGLYMDPPHNAVVFSFDEKSQIRALARAQPILPMDFGQPERRTHNYIRNGTLDLFAALNVATGEVLAKCTRRHRAKDFVAFLDDIDASVEADVEIHVILDNLSAHKAPVVQRWLLRHPRVQFHFTPTYASWLNLVARFFGLLTEKALRRGSHTSLPQLRAAILAHVDTHNERRKPLRWTKTANEILDKMRRFGLRVQQVHGQ